jgi:hypothetical protein
VLVSALAASTLLASGLLAGSGTSAAAPTGSPPPDRASTAKALLEHHHARFGTAPLVRALGLTAGTGAPTTRDAGTPGPHAAAVAHGGEQPHPRSGLTNVRVNDPAADRYRVDQTTQSETSIAVAGRRVAVGFNDSQQSLAGLTDGADLSGYGYSTDGGRSFTDGGTLPNRPGFANFGDPWLTADRAGRMYYATLAYGGNVGNLEVGVSRSADGGRSWTAPVLASPNNDHLFYFGDKEAVTAGRDPKVAGRDNLYLAWDDISLDPSNGQATTGLPVATSTDQGRSWTTHYADLLPIDPYGCSFTQYIGAQPLVDPANGTLHVAAEKIAVDDPNCSGGQVTYRQVIFTSTDGGTTFDKGVTVADVTPATPNGALQLAPGMVIRTIEVPTLAIREGTIWLAWNGGSGGHSHIALASSTDGGATWSTRQVTGGSGDELQPALSADRTGLHLAYYQRNAGNTLDTVVADSTDLGAHFTTTTITSRSFPGVATLPQFDPLIAAGYMGDYIANVSDGTHQYFAWGDNRDRIVDFTHPQGRNDPDVFFARR